MVWTFQYKTSETIAQNVSFFCCGGETSRDRIDLPKYDTYTKLATRRFKAKALLSPSKPQFCLIPLMTFTFGKKKKKVTEHPLQHMYAKQESSQEWDSVNSYNKQDKQTKTYAAQFPTLSSIIERSANP